MLLLSGCFFFCLNLPADFFLMLCCLPLPEDFLTLLLLGCFFLIILFHTFIGSNQPSP
jgi:hypothetical protein